MPERRRGRVLGRRLLALWLGVWVGGCSATRPVAPRPPVSRPSVAALEAALAARRAAIGSLRALAHLRYRDGDESVSSRDAIVVARPDRVRVEVLSLLGAVFLLVADNGSMTAYARAENTVYRGAATPQNLQRYIRLGLPVHEIVDVVLGTPPVRAARDAVVGFDPAAGAIALRRDLTAGSQVIWVSEASLPLAAEERTADGVVAWRATFSDYEDHGGVWVATHIGLDVPPWAQSVEISLRDVEVNPALDHSIFAVPVPHGSKVVDLQRVAN